MAQAVSRIDEAHSRLTEVRADLISQLDECKNKQEALKNSVQQLNVLFQAS